ncbi:MAG: GNAT family N-acetyltransferase [Bacteroidota bacterium]
MQFGITSATDFDIEEIIFLAKCFDLDVEEISSRQFVVAKKKNKIIGFGRLREHSDCTEIATVGVIKEKRHNGIGSAVVNELIKRGPKEIYVLSVLHHFFSRLCFKEVKKIPAVFQKKIDFCKQYGFKEDEIFVMLNKKVTG